MHQIPRLSDAVPGPTAEAFDPVLETFKRDIDFTLVERNLRLSTEERVQQLVNATRFIGKLGLFSMCSGYVPTAPVASRRIQRPECNHTVALPRVRGSC
jgi:hypothetical protein